MGTVSTTEKGKGKSAMRPRLMFADSNESGTGSAIQVELHPATLDRPGSLMLEFAKQTDPGYVDSDGYHNGGFDWAGSLKFRIKLAVVGKMLNVLQGSSEFLMDEKDEEFMIRRKNDSVLFYCDHIYNIGPKGDKHGVKLEAYIDGEPDSGHSYILDKDEIVILRHAIESSMGVLAWGEGAAE